MKVQKMNANDLEKRLNKSSASGACQMQKTTQDIEETENTINEQV